MPQPWKFSSSCRARSSTASGRAPGPALKLCTRRVIRFFSEKLMLVVSITLHLSASCAPPRKEPAARVRSMQPLQRRGRSETARPRRHWKGLSLKNTSTALLRRRAFDDAERRRRGNDARQVEARSIEQSAEFGSRALAPALGHDQHFEVHQLAERRRVTRLDHRIHDKQLAVRCNGTAAVAQDGDAPLAVPVVDDVLHQVGVATLGQGSERSEEHTSELQSPCNLVCRLLLEKKKKKIIMRSRRV